MISKQTDTYTYFRIKDHRYHKYCGEFYKGIFIITDIKQPYLRSLLRHCDPNEIIHTQKGLRYLNEPWVKYVVINNHLISFLSEDEPKNYFYKYVGTFNTHDDINRDDPTQFLEMFKNT